MEHTRRESNGTRVLVVGPVGGRGGMACVTRMTVSVGDSAGIDVVACDTTKDTPVGRTLPSAAWSHVRRQGRLVQSLIAHRPHVVHIHTCSYSTFYRTIADCITCRMFRRPYVLHIHGGLFTEFVSGLRGWRRARVAGVLCRAERVVVLGEHWRRELGRMIAGLRMTVIPNAIEMDGPPAVDDPRGGGILFVGDLSEVKRPEDLVLAYASLPSAIRRKFPLTIVGDGTRQRRRLLVRLADRVGVLDSVRFAGPLDRREVADMMAAADLLVMPSRAEGMPLVLLEAMRAAVACVVTDVGAVAEMAQDGVEASIVAPQDSKALLDVMHALLKDPPRRRAMGAAAARRVRQYHDITTFHQAIGSLWHDVATEQVSVQPQPVPRLAVSPLRTIL